MRDLDLIGAGVDLQHLGVAGELLDAPSNEPGDVSMDLVADIGAQIDVQIAAGGFSDKDISTLMVGANDIFALYAQYPARSEAALIAVATQTSPDAAPPPVHPVETAP